MAGSYCCSSGGLEESDSDVEEGPLAASHVGEGLAEVPPHLAAALGLRSLCLHGNAIRCIEGLAGLCRLRDLNLSSNCLEAVDGLQSLSRLTNLNLASNNLAAVRGLEGLLSLRRLTLSHNCLTSLQVRRGQGLLARRPGLSLLCGATDLQSDKPCSAFAGSREGAPILSSRQAACRAWRRFMAGRWSCWTCATTPLPRCTSSWCWRAARTLPSCWWRAVCQVQREGCRVQCLNVWPL